MKSVINVISIGLFIVMMATLTLTSGCNDDGPVVDRINSEADSIALCKIMAAGPVYYEYQHKWDPKKINSLPPDWKVYWRMCEDGKNHIVGMVVCAYDYRLPGRVSEAFADLEYLETVVIMGPGWEGQLPENFGQNITEIEVKETSLTSIDCKMNLGEICRFVVQDNPFLTKLPDLSTLGRDLDYRQLLYVVIASNKSLSGQAPSINIYDVLHYSIRIVDNEFTSIDYHPVGRYTCWSNSKYINMSNNKISGTLPDYITNDPHRLVRAYHILNPQSDGCGFSNMPSDEEVARIKKELNLPNSAY